MENYRSKKKKWLGFICALLGIIASEASQLPWRQNRVALRLKEYNAATKYALLPAMKLGGWATTAPYAHGSEKRVWIWSLLTSSTYALDCFIIYAGEL